MTAILAAAPWLGMILSGVIAAATIWFHKKAADNKVAAVTAKADSAVAAATTDRDTAVVAAAQVREVAAKANDAATQQTLADVQERSNVEAETSANSRAANEQWMRDNGFIKPADAAGDQAAVSGAGSDCGAKSS